jgi:hypothetical protein
VRVVSEWCEFEYEWCELYLSGASLNMSGASCIWIWCAICTLSKPVHMSILRISTDAPSDIKINEILNFYISWLLRLYYAFSCCAFLNFDFMLLTAVVQRLHVCGLFLCSWISILLLSGLSLQGCLKILNSISNWESKYLELVFSTISWAIFTGPSQVQTLVLDLQFNI